MSAVLSILFLLALPAGGKTPTPGAAPAAAAVTRADSAARSYCDAWKSGDVKAMTSLFAASRRNSQLQESFGSLAGRGAVRCASGPSPARPETTAGGAIVFAIPIAGYVYSPFENIPQYAGPTRFVFFPLLVLTGLWMWKGHVVRRLFSKNSAEQAAAVNP